MLRVADDWRVDCKACVSTNINPIAIQGDRNDGFRRRKH